MRPFGLKESVEVIRNSYSHLLMAAKFNWPTGDWIDY